MLEVFFMHQSKNVLVSMAYRQPCKPFRVTLSHSFSPTFCTFFIFILLLLRFLGCILKYIFLLVYWHFNNQELRSYQLHPAITKSLKESLLYFIGFFAYKVSSFMIRQSLNIRCVITLQLYASSSGNQNTCMDLLLIEPCLYFVLNINEFGGRS